MLRSCFVAAIPVMVALAAHAADQPTGRGVAATCANCHTATARPEAVIRTLAGMSAADLTRAMQGFKSGERPGTVMPQLAKGYTDAQIEAVARWYAAQTP
ncbi:MAG: cytochrome C [Casimicrobiaceae bacterium]